MRVLQRIIAVVLISAVTGSAWALEPDQVLAVANTNVADSVVLAGYYAKARATSQISESTLARRVPLIAVQPAGRKRGECGIDRPRVIVHTNARNQAMRGGIILRPGIREDAR